VIDDPGLSLVGDNASVGAVTVRALLVGLSTPRQLVANTGVTE